jgi:hypothetical protein
MQQAVRGALAKRMALSYSREAAPRIFAMNGMAHRHNAAMAQKPELRLRIPSPPAAGERRDPAGVQPSGAQRGEDALARWRDIAQCDAGILPCEQPPRKGSPAQQDE